MVLTGEVIRAARAMARLDQQALAGRSGLSLETIKRLERIRGPVNANVRTLAAIVSAFQREGVMIELQGDGGACLRLASVSAQAPATPPAPRPTRRDDDGLYRLIYCSVAQPATLQNLTTELDDILANSTRRNMELDVTGALLASNGRFLQALEGARAAVLQVYGAIALDHRHRDLQLLESGAIHRRRFTGWLMCARGAAPRGGFAPETLSGAAALELLTLLSDIERPELEASGWA